MEYYIAGSDCGFATFADRPVGTSDLAFKKLQALSQAAALLRSGGPCLLFMTGAALSERGLAAVTIDASLDGIRQAMITIEPEGGSETPTQRDVIMQGDLTL